MKKLFIYSLTILTLGLNSPLASAQSEDFVEYANCLEEDYIQVEAEEVVISTRGLTYTPKCIIVRPGTRITIPGSGFHPLQAAEDFNGVENPFFNPNADHNTAQTRTLFTPGFYGYFCTNHGDELTGDGMAGMIRVKELDL